MARSLNRFTKLALVVSALFCAPSAWGQGAYVPVKQVNSVVNGLMRPVQATLTVCAASTAGLPCAPPLANALFKDSALTQPLANPTTTDANGNYPQMALAAGSYTLTETAAGFTGFSYQFTIACAAGGCTAGPLTVSGTLNGECVVTSTASLSAANATCSTSSTKIHIWPGAGIVSGAGLTIAAQLQVDAGTQISGSPTINGPIFAGPYQIFTGTPTLGQTNSPIRAVWFPGTDFHAQWQNAYNAAPAAPSNTQIILDPNPAGGPWTTTTSVAMTTVNKYASIIVNAPPNGTAGSTGFFDNFTPTITGSAATITAISFAGSTVTVTAANSFSAGNIVTVRGVSPTDYNGVWIVATASGTGFTYTASLSGGIAAGSTGTAAVSPVAVEIDWTPNAGGAYEPNPTMQGFNIINNGCTTNGGCGSYAVGLLLGRAHGGAENANFLANRFSGFGTGIAKVNGPNASVGWGVAHYGSSLSWNNVGLFMGVLDENDAWYTGRMAVNGVNIQLKGQAELTVSGGSIDSATICGVSASGLAQLHSTDVHYENLGISGNFCIYESGGNPVVTVLDMKGGYITDDNTNGGGPSTPFVTAGYIFVNNTQLFSTGQSVTSQVFSAQTTGRVDLFNNSPSVFTDTQICGVSITCTANVTSSARRNWYVAGTSASAETSAPGAGTAAYDVCYGDSTIHMEKCSYNNNSNGGNTFFPTPQTGNTGGTHSDSGFYQTASASGCTTAASIGGVCATAITINWPVAFADANYRVFCTPVGPATNLPSNPYVVTPIAASVTINYFAITAAAASWPTVNCEAVHN